MSPAVHKGNKHLIVVGDRVLIKCEDGEERTKVGLYLPPTSNLYFNRVTLDGP